MKFLVFMCPKCKRFTNAPLMQKRRRCSYCGKIIDISKANVALFNDHHQAILATKQFNAGKNEEFDLAVEKSRDRIRLLIPTKPVSVSEIVDEGIDANLPSGKMKRLTTMLEREAKSRACSLDRLEKLSSKYQLEWPWIESALEKLANQGEITFPRPWSVRLVPTKVSKNKAEAESTDVTNEITSYLKRIGGTAQVRLLLEYFAEMGITSESVWESLDRLMTKGSIYEPKSGVVSLVDRI